MPFVLVDPSGSRLAALGEGGALVVGRSTDCALALADPTVSRRHAELVGARDHLMVRDLGSRNGTFRNGVRVQSARLRPGDTVTFGVVAVRIAQAPDGGSARRVAPGEARTGLLDVSSPPIIGYASGDFGGGPVPRDGGAFDAYGPPSVSVASPPAGVDGLAGVPKADAADEPEIVAERGGAAPQELTARRLALLLEATRALGGAADTEAVVTRVVTALLRTLDADRAAVFRVAPGVGLVTPGGSASAPAEDELLTAAARDRWDADLTVAGATPLPRSVARVALARRSAVLTVDAAVDPRFTGQSVLHQRVRSALCAPLLAADGTALGAVYVDSGDPARAFREADLDFLAAFAGVAAAALENARLGERLRREAVSRENFARYFAAPVAARIAASDAPARPGGERRTVAVLFADLRGFTRLAAGLPPDEVADTLSEFLSAMVDCVFRHGGTLDKFIGDCVMAQWGAPEGSPEDADRALAAALAMHGALATLNRRRAARGRGPLAMGVGLAFGEVFAGNIGSERRLEFTVIGNAANQASRLCDAAAAGQTLVTDALRRALKGPAPAMRQVPVADLPGEPGPAVAYAVETSPTGAFDDAFGDPPPSPSGAFRRPTPGEALYETPSDEAGGALGDRPSGPPGA